ncbi:MAG: hypothetical protein J6S23_02640 [Clostridia bacterium]|nr:hypothetical protein [Clostridia bacterium]
MKKLLALTLVALMLLTSLTACDMESAKGHLINFLEQFTTTAEPEKVVRTTITEEEWLNAFKVNNFAIKASQDDDAGFRLVVDGSKVIYEMKMSEQGISLTCDLEKHIIITNTKAGNLAYVDESVAVDGELTLETMGIIEQYAFADITYSEETKSYTYTDEYETVEFFFEEGALVKIVMGSPDEVGMSGEIVDIGTSVVEIGEYIVVNDGKVDPSKAAEDVVTTVTDEQLAAHLDLRNFTINAVTLQYGLYAVEASLKAADTAFELALNVAGENQTQYMALVDGEFLSIERLGDGHLATPIGATIEDLEGAIEVAREYMKVEYLTYNEDGRYYTLDVEGETFYLYFENGQIVKAVYVIKEGEMMSEVILGVSNVGTTEVVLPEYTLNTNE